MREELLNHSVKFSEKIPIPTGGKDDHKINVFPMNDEKHAIFSGIFALQELER
jgi:hypothetical protein